MTKRARPESKGPAIAQPPAWSGPALERELLPPADHGETSYRGTGKLKGKRTLITGGDSGIGRAIAIAFAREGADVAIAYYNEHDDAQETLRWVREAGTRGLAVQGDLAQRDHCREVVRAAVEEFGGLDVLVNNAGVHFDATAIADITVEHLERTFRTNLFAAVWTAQAALEHMGQGAVILNTGSVAGMGGHPALIDYAATKAGLHNFTKSLAQQVAHKGIRVNCVAPGPVWTPFVREDGRGPAIDEFGADTLWKRPAQPAEIAPTYVFLASPDARYYTGEIFAPTGLPLTNR